MEKQQVASIGSFCLNESCGDYKKVGLSNVVKCGKTDTGVQRYRCKTCRKSFTETKGTMFYRCRRSKEEIVDCMAMLGDRNSLAAIHRIKGIKEETVFRWMKKAESHIKQFEEYLVRNHKLSEAQLDALWTYVGHKGEKGGDPRKVQEALFGAEQPSISKLVCGLDVR
jgi:transposase-like protein